MTMTSEGGFQKELIDEYNNKGGYAFKASNVYTTGVPDLSIQPMPDRVDGRAVSQHIKMECKFVQVTTTTRQVTKSLNTPQERHLNKTTTAGGLAVWAIGYTYTDCQRWGLFICHAMLGKAHTIMRADLDDLTLPGHFAKPKGGVWPVAHITAMIYEAEQGNRHMYANWSEG